MKNLVKKISLLSMAALLGGCNVQENIESFFGAFGYNGTFLQEYATKQIGVEEAKTLVDISYTMPKFSTKRNCGRDEANVKLVLTKYASLITTVKYYVDGNEEQQVRHDMYQGTDFKYLVETNHYEPFGQMSVKYIFVDDDLLDDMEEENNEFKNSEGNYITPFNDLYTYHTNEDKTLIVQTHNFAELPASTGGGIGSTFRQDCELVFDPEGKITLWQSSLGIYTSTPTGTSKEGYIFEVGFEWIAK